jgi:hypothetical protein
LYCKFAQSQFGSRKLAETMTAPVQDKEKVRKAGAAYARKKIDKLFEKSKIVDSSVSENVVVKMSS